MPPANTSRIPIAFHRPWTREAIGTEMLRADLDAAGIASTDDFGRRLDFHSLRHICGTRLARNGVPLAVAQIMWHSTPVLTTNFYTHVLVADKAKELAKLPALVPDIPEIDAAQKTGTDDFPLAERIKTTDRKMDRNGVDSTAKIKTYMDSDRAEKQSQSTPPETQKSPDSQGKFGGEGGIRTLDRGYPLCRLSKPVHSTTLPPLRLRSMR